MDYVDANHHLTRTTGRCTLIALDTIVAWSSHISTILFLTGILHLSLVGVRRAQLPNENPIKRYGETVASVALLPVGIFQFTSFIVYLIAIILGLRGPALLPPEWSIWTIPYTVLQGGSMLVGSMSAIGQAGRKVPWSVMAGGGAAALAGGGVWTSTSFLGGYTPLALSSFIAIVMFVAMFYLTEPARATIAAVGDVFAYSPFVIGNGALMTILGFISGIGVVIL